MASDTDTAKTSERTREIVRELLALISFDQIDGEALRNTPGRVHRSFKELYGGYRQDPAAILALTFVRSGVDEMVAVTHVPFFSMCEHHMLPIIGTAHVGYIPDGRIVGISKIPRLIECYSRRLQLQERMTSDIADAFMRHVAPKGVGVIMSAEHTCMTMRGVNKPGSRTVTSAMRGLFKDDPKTRAEFLRLIEEGGRKP